MALLRHLLCGLVLLCLPIDAETKTHVNTDDFRCPAKFGEDYCDLDQVQQPIDPTGNTKDAFPVTIFLHCTRTDKVSNPAGGERFTRERCHMFNGYVQHKKKANTNYFHLYKLFQCKGDGWQTGQTCRFRKRSGKMGTYDENDWENTALFIGSEETMMQKVQEKINDYTPDSLKKQFTGNNPTAKVDKPESVKTDSDKTAPPFVGDRGFHNSKRDGKIYFAISFGVVVVVNMFVNYGLLNDGWLFNVHGVPFVAPRTSQIILINQAVMDNVPPRDLLVIQHIVGKIPNVQHSIGAYSEKLYRNATTSPKWFAIRICFIIAEYLGVDWINSMVIWWVGGLVFDIFGVLDPGPKPTPQLLKLQQQQQQQQQLQQQQPQTTWLPMIGGWFCAMPAFFCSILRALSDMRKIDICKTLRPRFNDYLCDVVFMGITGLGYYDHFGFFEWRIFIFGILQCSPLLHSLGCHVWNPTRVVEGANEDFIKDMYTEMTALTDAGKSFVFFSFGIHVCSLSILWKDMVSAGRSGSVSWSTHVVLMLYVIMMIISVYFAQDSVTFRHCILSQYWNLWWTPWPETLIAMWGDVPDYSSFLWGYPYWLVQLFLLTQSTGFFWMFLFILLICVQSDRDHRKRMWNQLSKCGYNMREFALTGAFVSIKLSLLYVCICWAVLGVWTCRVTNTDTKDVMHIVHYSNRTIESKIEVPLVVHTWMHTMIHFSSVHVLFVIWWGACGKHTQKYPCFNCLHGKSLNSTNHNCGSATQANAVDGHEINQILRVPIMPTADVSDVCLVPFWLVFVGLFVVHAMTTVSLFLGLLCFICISWQVLKIKTEFENVPSPHAVGSPLALDRLFLPAANIGTEGHWRLAKNIFIRRHTGQHTVTPTLLTTVFYLFKQEECGMHVMCAREEITTIGVVTAGYDVHTFEYQPAKADDICE